MDFGRFFGWIYNIFGLKKEVRLGIYGEVNAGKTTLANRISLDWTGTSV